MTKPPVWEVYNGEIKELRDQGLTLQAIGDKVGVTRERVRQILNEHYNTAGISGLIARYQLAQIIGCSEPRLKMLEREGKLNPLHSGRSFFYNRDEAERAVLALQRFCLHCGEPLPLKHSAKYCSKCQKDYRRNAYHFVSKESKRRRIEASESWHRRHPEKTQEIVNRAVAKFMAKKRKEHYATTQYVVVHPGVMPIGSLVKAVGCERSHFILENSLRIPVSHLRIQR